MVFALRDPRLDPYWDRKLLGVEGATIFHSAAWAKTLAEAYGFSPCYVVAAEEDDEVGLLPIMDVSSLLSGRRGVSLPFSDFCEPLGFHSSSEAALKNALVSIGRQRKWRFLDVRGGGSLFGDAPAAATFLTHTMSLSTDESRLFGRLRDDTRRNIATAQRRGVEVRLDTDPASLRSFYRLNCLTRRDHGLPPQPFSFFRRVQKNLLDGGLGTVALASIDGQVVAAALFFHFGKCALYKFGASDKRYWPLRPNDLLMWEAIRWHGTRGYSHLSFGRTDMDHEGLRRYKAKWGAVEGIIRYHRLAVGQGEFVTVRPCRSALASKIFRFMPIPVSRCISRVIYRHAA